MSNVLVSLCCGSASAVDVLNAFDHTNYTRWLPIHIKDMILLKENQTVPSASKATSLYSSQHKAMDQAHEQMNDLIKRDGGVIGITDNPSI